MSGTWIRIENYKFCLGSFKKYYFLKKKKEKNKKLSRVSTNPMFDNDFSVFMHTLRYIDR